MSDHSKIILLTGAAGFIGSHVAIRLVQSYPHYRVIGFDKMDYCASEKNLEAIRESDNFTFIRGDILNLDFVCHILKQYKVTHIMHFAAQSHVDNSFGNSLTFTQNNVLGTHSMLEAARLSGDQIKLFLHVSTDEVYGENKEKNEEAFGEQFLLAPTNPYAGSKAAAEMLVTAYNQSFKLPVIITRGNNTFGPHQYPEKLIPKFINLLKRGRKCCLHGDGSHRRSFVFVADVAEAFDTILHKGALGEIYNIGTDYEITNKEVAKTLIKMMDIKGSEDDLIEYVRDRDFNDRRYHVNYDKIVGLGWKPTTDFEEGLKRTIEWYGAHPNHFGIIDSVLVAHPTATLNQTK